MKRNTKSVPGGLSDKAFNIVICVLLGLFALAILYPLYFVVIASISDPAAIGAGEVILWPKGLNIDGYRAVFQDSKIWTGYLNSFLYAVLGTTICVTLTVSAAYPLSRAEFRGRKYIMMFFTLTMFVSGGMIPAYIVINNLHLMNTIWSIVLPSAVTAYNLIITRTFIQSSLPNELYEAAAIDGCGQGRFFFQILLPLVKPIIAVLVLFSVVNMWNQYMQPMLYLSDQTKYPLQVILRGVLVQNTADISMLDDMDALLDQMKLAEKIKYALIIIASAPVVALYPLVQKHLVKGVMIGSVKG